MITNDLNQKARLGQDENLLINLEAIARRCFQKMMFLKILQNSQKNNSTGISFLQIAGLVHNFIKKGLQHSCFAMNFAKFLRINWSLLTILKTNKKVYVLMFFQYVKVYIFWKFTQYTIHWDKVNVKNVPSDKIYLQF